jgi:hypothetical protein
MMATLRVLFGCDRDPAGDRAVAGLGGGILFGMLMQMIGMVAMLVGWTSAAVSWSH